MRDYKTLLAKVESDESGGGGGAGVEAAMEDGQAPPAERNGWRRLQALFMQLRKCCNHPYMFPDAEKHFDGSTGEDLVSGMRGNKEQTRPRGWCVSSSPLSLGWILRVGGFHLSRWLMAQSTYAITVISGVLNPIAMLRFQ